MDQLTCLLYVNKSPNLPVIGASGGLEVAPAIRR